MSADWQAVAQAIEWPEHLLIDGADVSSANGASAPHHSPRDGALIARTPLGAEVDVDRAVAAARAAFDNGPWARMTARERGAALVRLADLIERDRRELAAMVSLEVGKPVEEAHDIELRTVIATYRWFGEVADKTLDEVAPTDADHLALVTREPVGVVGVVTPWNFPLTLSAWKIAPALAVGCCVVHKPSDLTPFSAIKIARLAREAGIPDGVFSVVTGIGPTVGRALGRHDYVDALAFTGSTTVGRAFQIYSAESNLKRTWLELGGKSPNIILPDVVDLEQAVATAAWGIFFNSGQMCTAPSRLIVDASIADEVVERLVAAASDYTPADPLAPGTRMGSLASHARVRDVAGHVDRALEDGATVRIGGHEVSVLDGGAYFAPTIVDHVRPGSRLAQDEVFGPVLAVVRVQDEEEAVRVANDSVYGLAAGLWTGSLSRAHRISRRLRAGTVWVNCYEEGDLTVPFGGYKQSGNGRDKSLHSLEKYTELKTTYLALP